MTAVLEQIKKDRASDNAVAVGVLRQIKWRIVSTEIQPFGNFSLIFILPTWLCRLSIPVEFPEVTTKTTFDAILPSNTYYSFICMNVLGLQIVKPKLFYSEPFNNSTRWFCRTIQSPDSTAIGLWARNYPLMCREKVASRLGYYAANYINVRAFSRQIMGAIRAFKPKEIQSDDCVVQQRLCIYLDEIKILQL